ncbi:type II CAAX prenyl endopeptidase Rce1 family protein [Pelagovum pacificum]|uniref:CPBP family intramembrane metalloprotease n=1 Tax=Pelagovum pacificum TaxID=2588711 RepID=A0A5C5GFV7_9RHOB|nr:CPBP family glutamic-type intramembrane protease [Pelagovum pacificum]QQA43222.1 CPBP family intramembrane metalloprotease [Pelagovum pacificum]TNY33638.1 CPBP family intramembrane metalloprotease [Pelagovum pacificum]
MTGRRRDWLEAAAMLAAIVLVALILNRFSGFPGQLQPNVDVSRAKQAALALLVPAIAEELVFRGPLLRPRLRSLPVAALLLATYLAWHPLAAWLFRPAMVPLFTDPAFLALTATLGLSATLSTWRSGTLLPAITLHWLTVAAWILGWGGPEG